MGQAGRTGPGSRPADAGPVLVAGAGAGDEHPLPPEEFQEGGRLEGAGEDHRAGGGQRRQGQADPPDGVLPDGQERGRVQLEDDVLRPEPGGGGLRNRPGGRGAAVRPRRAGRSGCRPGRDRFLPQALPEEGQQVASFATVRRRRGFLRLAKAGT
jgi:hypothetical protein